MTDAQGCDSFEIYIVTDSSFIRWDNRSVWGDSNSRFNNVFRPVTRARGNIAGQTKTFKGRESDIMRATDAGFEHPAAPHRHAALATHTLRSFRFRMTANATEFDINDAARAYRNRLARVVAE